MGAIHWQRQLVMLFFMLKPGFFEEVTLKGDYMAKKLKGLVNQYPKIFVEHRGKGLMQGLVCGPLNTDVVKALRDEKFLALGASENVVRFVPPLIVSEAQIDEAVSVLGRVAQKLS